MGRMMRRSQEEKREIIHLVEHSSLAMKKTLDELNVPRSTFYRWYQLYQEDGEEGLIDRRPNPHQFWNRIPQSVRDQVVAKALEHPDQSCRQIAWRFTDEQGYFISESSVYRILKRFDLVESPSFHVVTAKDKFQHPTQRVNELWQTDFTYFKILRWGWYYLSTVLDDYSRCILAWMLSGPYKLDGTTWEQEKPGLMDRIIKYYSQRYVPGLAEHVQVAEFSTPADFAKRLLSPEGAIYALRQDVPHSICFRPAAKSKSIKGLYLVGASTHPGGGIPVVISSAMNADDLIEKYEK